MLAKSRNDKEEFQQVRKLVVFFVSEYQGSQDIMPETKNVLTLHFLILLLV